MGYAEAFEKLIVENVLFNRKSKNWHIFRMKELWNAEVNHQFECNIKLLEKVYQSFYKPMKNWMSREDAINLVV